MEHTVMPAQGAEKSQGHAGASAGQPGVNKCQVQWETPSQKQGDV